MDDWYNVKALDINDKSGRGLLKKYNNSIVKLLSSVYPNHDWKPWLFGGKSKVLSSGEEMQKEFIEWLEKDLNIKDKEDWYKIKISEIEKRGGSSFLQKYEGSLYKAFSSIYPNVSWKPWLFETQNRDIFNDESLNLKEILPWLEKKLSITKPEQWYEVAQEHVIHFAGRALVANGFNTLIDTLLSKAYPEVQWKEEQFIATSLKTQRLLYRILRNLLSKDVEIKFEYEHPSLKFSQNQQPITLDIYVPSLNLALEYHGEHHFRDSRLYGRSNVQRERDLEKKKICEKAGISLIEFGYWWDLEKPTVVATIHKYRPDLFKHQGEGNPISEFPPGEENSTKKTRHYTEENVDKEKEKIWNLFSNIFGAHHSMIQSWIDKGYKNLDDLINKKVYDSLPDSVKIGIKYYRDFFRSNSEKGG